MLLALPRLVASASSMIARRNPAAALPRMITSLFVFAMHWAPAGTLHAVGTSSGSMGADQASVG
jgi:hypothetical protein